MRYIKNIQNLGEYLKIEVVGIFPPIRKINKGVVLQGKARQGKVDKR